MSEMKIKEKEETLTFRVPKTLGLELKAIPETGYYHNVSEFLRDSINMLLYSRRDLRMALSGYLYKNGYISLGKASEILGENLEEAKKILLKMKVKLNRGAKSQKEINKELTWLT